MQRLLAVTLVLVGGCTLYFDGPGDDTPAPPSVPPDAPSAACPKPGTYAEILYPLDGATNVPQPVPIKTRVVIPNTLDGKGLYLTDASGVPVSLEHNDPSCSIAPPRLPTGPTQDQTWTSCFKDLEPDAEYTWHIWITCYDPSGPNEIATSTFRTAP